MPGDALLFAVGTFAGAGLLSPWLGSIVVFVASVAGDTVNYGIGRCLGTRPAARYPRLIPARHLETSGACLARYGGRTVFLAGFVPVVCSFVPLTAGMSRKPPAKGARLVKKQREKTRGRITVAADEK